MGEEKKPQFKEMKPYRRIPTLAYAAQFQPEDKPWPEGVTEDTTSPTGFRIKTLENTNVGFEVTPGDWIIKGIVGELYACKPDIFYRTYEADDSI